MPGHAAIVTPGMSLEPNHQENPELAGVFQGPWCPGLHMEYQSLGKEVVLSEERVPTLLIMGNYDDGGEVELGRKFELCYEMGLL